jgi:hypothetical protein
MVTHIDQIKEIIKNFPIDGVPTKIKHNKELFESVNSWTKDIKCDTISEKIYCFVNCISTTPHCKCGKELKFISITAGYREFCSDRKCKYAIKAATERRIATMIANGGVGLANPVSKEKAKNTVIEKYGVTNTFLLPEVLEKMATNHPMRRPEVVDKIRQDCITEHGVNWHSKRPEVIEKTTNTVKEIYGVGNHSQLHYGDGVLSILTDYDKMNKLFNSMSITDIAKHLSISDTTVLKYLRILNIRQPTEILPEKQIKEWLSLQGFSDFEKTRTVLSNMQELDLYSPTEKIAVEYCGLYWHSQRYKTTKYHRKKYIECKNLGIKLITIFEDEWLNNRKIVENRLLHILGKNKTNIGARTLTIVEVDNGAAKQFFDKHHISGYTISSVQCAAIDKDGNIRSIMSFGKNRKFIKPAIDYEWEMIRFSTDGSNIAGIAGKLFKYFIKNYDPTSVLSYADLRWGDGEYLKNIGFKRYDDTPPNYWYFSLKNAEFKRYHRFLFNKKAIMKKFSIVDTNKSEYELAKESGLERIWDCGNAKWIWTK